MARNSGSWSSEGWEETFPSGMAQVEFKDGFGSFGIWASSGIDGIEGTGSKDVLTGSEKNLKSGIDLESRNPNQNWFSMG